MALLPDMNVKCLICGRGLSKSFGRWSHINTPPSPHPPQPDPATFDDPIGNV